MLLSFYLRGIDSSTFAQQLKEAVQSRLSILRINPGWLADLDGLRHENSLLKERIGRLSTEKQLIQEAWIENFRLRQLLDFSRSHPGRFLAAEVVGRGSVGLPGAVHLNVGWEDGCTKNSVLVTPEGVAGKVVAVYEKASVGQLVTDPNFRIGAVIQRSRVQGILRWLHGNLCLIEGIPLRSDVQSGDKVVTSSASTIYPAGLVLGHVKDIAYSEDGLSLRVLVRMSVDFQTLEELLIMVTPPDNPRKEEAK